MSRHRIPIDLPSIALFCVTLLCCFVMSEAVARWVIFGRKGLSYSAMRTAIHIGQSGLLQASEHQDILWELKPRQESIYKFFPFSTNAFGLRDREYSFERPSQTYRVAVIGDSFTMGEGVAIEDVYHSLLERRFNELSRLEKFEFVNFGVAGYSLPQYIATIRHKVTRFSPDVILIGFCAANDSEPPNFEAFKQPYRVLPIGNGFFRSYLFSRIGDIYKRYYNILRNRSPGYDADAEYVDQQFQSLSSLSKEINIPVIVAYIDNRAASSDRSLVESTAKKFGFDFIDATDGFSPERSTEHIIYLTDNHPNAVANRIMAESLFRQLQTREDFRSRMR